jgi:hypothetical protein
MRIGTVGGALIIAASVMFAVAAAIGLAGGSVYVGWDTPGALAVTSAVILLAVGAGLVALAGPRRLTGRMVRGGLALVAVGLISTIATSKVGVSSMLVLVYLAGGLLSVIGVAVASIGLARSRDGRRAGATLLVGLILFATAGALANVASASRMSGAGSDGPGVIGMLGVALVIVGCATMAFGLASIGWLALDRTAGAAGIVSDLETVR